MAQVVSDEVWQQLDPSAGRLSRRQSVRLWLTVALTVVLTAAGLVTWWSGLVTPRVVWDEELGFEYRFPAGGPVSYQVAITNAGFIPVTLLGAGRDGPGLRLTDVEGQFPVTLDPGQSFSFVLTFALTDCTAVTNDNWPVPVRVQRWWGEQTAWIRIPLRPADEPHDPLAPARPDPEGIEWQRNLAMDAC